MPVNYISVPTKFSNAAYYNKYATTESSHSAELWQEFINSFFGSPTQTRYLQTRPTTDPMVTASLYNIMRSGATWPTSSSDASSDSTRALAYYNDYEFIEGMFGALLRNFFYDYAPTHLNTATEMNTAANIKTAFIAYLASSNRDPVTQKQNTIFLWLWQLLTQMLSEINNATLTQGGYLLAMTSAENAAATNMAGITYTPQSNDQDFATQATNMNRQKNAEIYRSQRSANGKKGQLAQSMITSLRDQATQQSQLMSSIMESMTSMYQSILKK